MATRLTFHGGAGTVTGSNFLLDTGGTKILVDCGFFQGAMDGEEAKNKEKFPYNPKEVEALFITHAHLDHTGRIPLLVREGFRGTIYSTAPTKDLAELILRDGIDVHGREEGGRDGFYTHADVDRALSLWRAIPYHEEVVLGGGVTAELKNTGHILGSAMVECMRGGKTIVFTGDLGNTPDPILPDAEPLTRADYLVMEAVYGDRPHEDKETRREKLEDIIEEAVRAKGVLLIPAFSIERTQEMLFEIKTMVDERRIPHLPVFLDSPLAIRATGVYQKYRGFLKKSVGEGDAIFSFPGLTQTLTRDESSRIEKTPNPKIIIAGSGMSNGGRIVCHEKKYLADPTTILFLVGYQAPGTTGRALEEGAREVDILGSRVRVRAQVKKVSGYSSHADMEGLLQFAVGVADTVKTVFVINSEPKTGAFFAQRLRDYVGIRAEAPQEGDSVELEF